MAMTSTDVLKLATSPVAGRSGHIAAARRFQVRNVRAGSVGAFGSTGQMPGDREQEQFLNDLDALTPKHVTTPRHLHPEARATNNPRLDQLTPSDLMWLQRLPQDPAEIPWEDAVQVGTLAKSISQVNSPSDGRLIQSVWRPIKVHHDQLAAKAELEAARAALPTVPASVVGALATALKAELPQHDDREVMTRAEAMLSEVLSTREAQWSQRIAAAEAAVQATTAAAQQRAETVRTA